MSHTQMQYYNAKLTTICSTLAQRQCLINAKKKSVIIIYIYFSIPKTLLHVYESNHLMVILCLCVH